MARDMYTEVTEKVLAAIAAGVSPWRQPWTPGVCKDGLPVSWPRNAGSGRAYHGVNVLLLNLATMTNGYRSGCWLTFRQALAAGGHVRKGQKGTTVIFWNWIEKTNDAGKKEKVPFLRAFTVFNVEQCDELNADKLADLDVQPCTTAIADAKRIQDALAADGCPTSHAERAAYSPTHDAIMMPRPQDFTTEGAYWGTFLHESTHATAPEKRCARKVDAKRFGDDAYAFEELVAEMGSAFLCARIGIDGNTEGHASYVDHWMKVLRADKYALFTAARESQNAAEWLLTKAGIVAVPETDDNEGEAEAA